MEFRACYHGMSGILAEGISRHVVGRAPIAVHSVVERAAEVLGQTKVCELYDATSDVFQRQHLEAHG